MTSMYGSALELDCHMVFRYDQNKGNKGRCIPVELTLRNISSDTFSTGLPVKSDCRQVPVRITDTFERSKTGKADQLMKNMSLLRNMSGGNSHFSASPAVAKRESDDHLRERCYRAYRDDDFVAAFQAASAISDESQKNGSLDDIAYDARSKGDFVTAYKMAKAITDEKQKNTRLDDIAYYARSNGDFTIACHTAAAITDEKQKNTRLDDIAYYARSNGDFTTAYHTAKAITDEKQRNTQLNDIAYYARSGGLFTTAYYTAIAITDEKQREKRLDDIAYYAHQAGDNALAEKAKRAIITLRAQKKAEKEIKEMAEGLARKEPSGVIEVLDDSINIQGTILQRKK